MSYLNDFPHTINYDGDLHEIIHRLKWLYEQFKLLEKEWEDYKKEIEEWKKDLEKHWNDFKIEIENRLDLFEQKITQLQNDFLTLKTDLYQKFNELNENVTSYLNTFNDKLENLETQVNNKFKQIEQHFTDVENKIENIESNITNVSNNVSSLKDIINQILQKIGGSSLKKDGDSYSITWNIGTNDSVLYGNMNVYGNDALTSYIKSHANPKENDVKVK